MTSSKYFEEPRTSTPYNDLAEIKNFGVEKSPIRPITSPVTQPGEQEEICAQLVAELQKVSINGTVKVKPNLMIW